MAKRVARRMMAAMTTGSSWGKWAPPRYRYGPRYTGWALAVALLAGCGGTQPSTASIEPTVMPYEYPDLPGHMEEAIAEGDCDELEVQLDFIGRDGVDPDTRVDVIAAVLHRSDEIGCGIVDP